VAGRAETRARLIAAAGEAFAERGLQDVSIDELARRAGFTKGAFYANFDSKEQLFLAMLDDRFERRAEEMRRALETGEDPEVQARRSGDEFTASLSADPEWQRLFFEFAAHAARDEAFRVELVERYRRLRDAMAEDYARRAAALDFTLPADPGELALMTFAMGNGLALERLLEPDAVPADLFGRMLEIWVAGLRALASPERPERGGA
jgi:AcrR family transcriptional regulator